jgi:uncharacterized NAD(P)/FAD-binding protein YdhS
VPLAITIVEPRAEVGYGMAYSSADPDHRLNGLPDNHVSDPEDPGALLRWYEAGGRLVLDPEARTADGGLYIRRRDFGRFMSEAVAAQPSIRHERDYAVGVSEEKSLTVKTQAGKALPSDVLVVATGHAAPSLPAAFAGVAGHPGVIEDPAENERIRAIGPDARVLVLGSGLTGLDILSTLVRGERRAPVTVVSRRGLKPRSQRPRREPQPGAPTLLERIQGEVAPWLLQAGDPPTIRLLLNAMRRRIREVAAEGETWHAAFDDLRDLLWRIWPRVAPAEKRRFQRLLRSWYDAHRFRAPPQNEAMVRAAEERGLVRYRAARIASVRARGNRIEVDGETFDAVINCTGSDAGAGVNANPFLSALIRSGLAAPDPSGMGLAVDMRYRAIGPDGRPRDRLRVIGPPSAGTFGDPFGAAFIALHARRMVPDVLKVLRT